MTQDVFLKVAISVISAMILALGGWVWSTGSNVQLLAVQKDHIEKELVRIESKQQTMVVKQEALEDDMNGTQKRLYGMERDIEYIKKGIDDIKKAMKELKE